MEDETLRKSLSVQARKIVETYAEERVMNQWIVMFTSLLDK